MKKFVFVCMLFALFASVCPCVADGVNGVLSEERVINLPQDQGKWYVSVVGNASDTNYQRVLGWFNNDIKLKKLRDTVHFCPITTNTAAYRERYAMNQGQYAITSLPCVRLQRSDGQVVYQASGKNIPMTAAGLYGALASGVKPSECIWRRPCPQPQPQPNPDPDPQPIDEQPIDEPLEVETALPPIWLTALMLVIGAGAGVVYQWKKTYAKK